MVISGGTLSPYLQRWMLFVDGENLTIRAQEFAHRISVDPSDDASYLRDVFIWPTKIDPRGAFGEPSRWGLQPMAVRAYYYTSQVGDETALTAARVRLRALGFEPRVFKKQKQQMKSKGVDIALATDVLRHAYAHHYDVAVLVAGDADYLPLVEEVKRTGAVVCVSFFQGDGLGLAPELQLAAERFQSMEPFLEPHLRALEEARSRRR